MRTDLIPAVPARSTPDPRPRRTTGRRRLLLAALLLTAPGTLHAAPVLEPSPVVALVMQAAAQDRVATGNQTVEAGESVGDIVVVGGDLRVRGEVTGDAVVVGGNLILEASGVILGDALVTGGEIRNDGGQVRGEMRMLDEVGSDISRDIRRALREGAQAEAAHEAHEAARMSHALERRPERSWFDPIRRGFAGLISTLALGLVLGGLGAVLVFYGRTYLETVSDTLRAATWRSAGTGLAASFLIVPAFVVMIVALAVSIVGIPLLLVAVPLYPLAIVCAAALGLLAAAHAIGERTAEQRRDAFDLRHRNAYSYLFTGLGMLLAPLLAAHLLGMTGFLGFVGTLLKAVMAVVIWAAGTAGLGAVILSRGGTRRTFVEPPLDPSLESEFFDAEPTPGGPHG